MKFFRKKETLIILLLTILTTFFIISCSSKPAATQEAVKVEGLYSVSSTSTLASVTVKTISDYEDQIYLLYNAVEANSTARTETLNGLYVLETVYGSISRAVETLNTAIAGADQIFALNDSLICIHDGKIISVDESGMLNWEIDDTGKTPLSLGYIKNEEDVQNLTVLFQSGNTFTAALINTADGSVLSETPFSSFAASDDYYGPFEAVGKTMMLTKADHYLLYDTNGVFITFNLDMDEKIIFIGTEGENSLYILTAMEENLYKITYNAEGEFLSRQQLAGNHTTLSRDLGINFTPLFDLPIQNPSSNAVYTLGNEGIANINPAGGDDPQDPPPNVNEPPTISFETQPSLLIQNDDGKTYGSAEMSILSNQPLKFLSREVSLSGGTVLFKDKQTLYTGVKIEEGKFRYTFTVQVQGGEAFQFGIQGIQEKNQNNESNTLTFVIRNNDTPSVPKLSFNGEKPLDEMTSKDTSAISVISNLPLDALIVKNNETSNKTDNPAINALLKTEEGFNFEYVFNQLLVEGNNKITISGENETGASSPVDASIFYNSPSVEVPTIFWHKKKESHEWHAPIRATTASTATLRIASTKPLTKLTITVDGQPSVINNPQGTAEENAPSVYSHQIDLSDGTTTISVVGENENGMSEQLNHEIVKWFSGNDNAQTCELAIVANPIYVVKEGTLAPIRFLSSKEIKTLSIISDQEQKILNYSQNGTGYAEVDEEGNFVYEISVDMRDDSEEAMDSAFREFSLSAKGFDVVQSQSSRGLSEEGLDIVHQMYVAYYQKPADPQGLEYWSAQLSEDQTFDLYSSGSDPQSAEEIISGVYAAVFGREPKQEEIEYWKQQDNSQGANLAFAIAFGVQCDQPLDKAEYSAEFVEAMDSDGDILEENPIPEEAVSYRIKNKRFHYEGIATVDKEKDGKKLKQVQFYGKNKNGQTEKSEPLQITHQDEPTEPPVLTFPEDNPPPQITTEELVEFSVQSDQEIDTLTITVNNEPPTVINDPDFVPVGGGSGDDTLILDTQVNVPVGDNTVSIVGENENGSSPRLTFSVERYIAANEPPQLSFPQDNPPPQITTEELVEFSVQSDQEIDTLTITVNNEPPTIIEDPDFVPVGGGSGDDTLILDTQVNVPVGNNTIGLVGENENGSSPRLTFSVERYIAANEPPQLSFPQDNPPPQITTEELVEFSVQSDQEIDTLTITVNNEPPTVINNPDFVPVGGSGDTLILDTQVNVPVGNNTIGLVGENENGSSPRLTFSVERYIAANEPPQLSFPQDNQPPQITTEELVEFSVQSDQEIDTLTITVNNEPPTVINDPDFVPVGGGAGNDTLILDTQVNVPVGDNTVSIVGENENGASDPLNFGVQRTAPAAPPVLTFPEDNPPPQITTEELVEFSVQSDQEIDTLTITVNNEPPTVIEDPDFVPVGGGAGDDTLILDTQVNVPVGENTVSIVGENGNGTSDPINFNVERTTPPASPVLELFEQPPAQTHDRIVEVVFRSPDPIFAFEITHGNEDPETVTAPNKEMRDGQPVVPLQLDLNVGENEFLIRGMFEEGWSNFVDFTITCNP